MKNFLFMFGFLLSFPLVSQNMPPVISNVLVEKGMDDILTITYDLEDAENDLCVITFKAANKGSQLFGFNTDNATGDLGADQSPGQGKQIIWDFSAYSGTANFRLMLVAEDGQVIDIQSIVDQVDSARIEEDLSFLEGVRHWISGAAHLSEVKDFIAFQFMENDLEVSLQEWDHGNYVAANIIGRKIGINQEEEVYILDGHFDSVNTSPGADDNASAVAGMLEAMRILSPYSFNKTIRFIGFDLEEAGLLGSIQYVQNGISTGESIEGVLNFEMIGYYSEVPNSQETPAGFSLLFPEAFAALEANEFRGDFINIIGNNIGMGLAGAFEQAIEEYVPSLNFITLEAPANWQLLVPDLGRSDHAPFWVAGLPALMLTDGANFRNPYYHTPQDTKDKINFTFMHQVVQASIATLAEAAGIQHAATWWTDTDFATPVTQLEECDFRISPNPTRDFVRLQWPNCQPGKLNIEVFDVQGHLVREYFKHQNQGGQTHWIDVRNLEKGIYYIRLQNQSSQLTRKVIVG